MDYGLNYDEAPAQPPATAMIPEAPATPGLGSAAPQAAPAQPEVGPEQRTIASALSFWRDPEKLKLAAMAAAEAQRPDLLNWIKQGYEASRENGIEALGALVAGSKDKALQLFNATGNMKATRIDDLPGGMHRITFADGTSRDLDAKKEFYSFLTPPEMARKEQGEAAVAAGVEKANITADARREIAGAQQQTAMARLGQQQAQFDARGAEREARIARDLAAAARSNASANGTDRVGAHETERTRRGNINRVGALVRDLVKTDPNTREKSGPSESERLMIKSLAVNYINKDGMDAEAAVSEAHDLVMSKKEEAEKLVEKEVADRKKAASGFIFDGKPDWAGAKDESSYRAKRTEEIVKYGLRDVLGSSKPVTEEAGKTPPSAPPAPRVQQRSTRNPGAQPSSAPDNPKPVATTTKAGQSPTSTPDARFKDGDEVRNKKTGQIFVYKNGTLVPK